ncbi:MAG: hypothetical protein HC845_02005 [Akkermansiaceae bacterium]|nr:hypothetical protein [Akkermansiaceae bacterium]
MIGVTEEDFSVPGTQFYLGVPPVAIDFLTTIPGLEFEPCWQKRSICEQNDFPVDYLAKPDLIIAKQTAGRPQDLADLDELRRAE